MSSYDGKSTDYTKDLSFLSYINAVFSLSIGYLFIPLIHFFFTPHYTHYACLEE